MTRLLLILVIASSPAWAQCVLAFNPFTARMECGGSGSGSGTPGGSNGDIQKNNAGAFGAATPGTDYEVPLTAGTGLSRSSNTFLIDTAIIPKFSTGADAPSAACTEGRETYTDTTADQLYICSAPNTWAKIPLSTFASYITFQAAICQGTTAGTNFSLPTANLPAATCITGSNINTGELLFDASTDETMQSWLLLPTGWTGAVDVAVKWRAAATSGNVVWSIQTICVADAETSDPAFNSADAFTVDAANGTTLQENDASKTGITTTGCAAGERMFFKFFRDADNGSDTMTGDAGLLSLTFTVRRTL